MMQTRSERPTALALLCLAGVALSACGSGTANESAASQSGASNFKITPAASDVSPGGVVKFQAMKEGTSGVPVAWTVQESNGGSIDASGKYTAPDAEGTYHILATSQATSRSSPAEVRVQKRASQPVLVSPHAAELSVGGSLTLTVELNGAADAGTWSVEEGVAGGSVNASGLYVAPQAPGTYHVIVASVVDPTHSDRATIIVAAAQPPPVPPPPTTQVVVAVSPAAVIVPAGQAVQLSAGVSGSSDTAVSWSVAEGSSGGAVSASGLYTAPFAGGTFHVVATSHADPARQFVAAVTVPGTPLPAAGDPNWVKVTDFGARGDGYTDDTAAFQSAAATGKNLLVPGTSAHYKVTGRIYVHGSVMGDGSLPTIRMYGADGGRDCQHVIFQLDDYAGPGAVFAGLHLDGQWDQTGTWGEWSHLLQIQGSTNVTIENNWLERAYGDLILIGGEASPNPSVNVVIQYNRLENPYRCTIALISARNVTVRGNKHVRSSTYVSAIDLEPNPNGLDAVWDVTISDEQFDVEGIAIQCYTFGGQSPQSGRVTIQRSGGIANRFFIKPPGTSDWTGLTLTNNTYAGRRAGSSGGISFAQVVDSSGGIVLTGNTVQPNGYGEDLFQGISSGLQLTSNSWQADGIGYTLRVTNAPGAQISANQLSGVDASINP